MSRSALSENSEDKREQVLGPSTEVRTLRCGKHPKKWTEEQISKDHNVQDLKERNSQK